MGLLVRIARHLAENVGEGNTFTIHSIAASLNAGPGAALIADLDSIERRLRDLPKLDWEYYTARNDDTLGSGVYRLVTIGRRIWEPGVSRGVTTSAKIESLNLEALEERDLERLASWIRRGERPADPVSDAWDIYCRLSLAAQRKVKASLFDLMMEEK